MVHVTLDADTVSKLTIFCSYSYSRSNKYSVPVLVILKPEYLEKIFLNLKYKRK